MLKYNKNRINNNMKVIGEIKRTSKKKMSIYNLFEDYPFISADQSTDLFNGFIAIKFECNYHEINGNENCFIDIYFVGFYFSSSTIKLK